MLKIKKHSRIVIILAVVSATVLSVRFAVDRSKLTDDYDPTKRLAEYPKDTVTTAKLSATETDIDVQNLKDKTVAESEAIPQQQGDRWWIAPKPDLDCEEYYHWSNSLINAYPFYHSFVVNNPTHKYGKAYFKNKGTYTVKVSIYNKKGILIGYDTVEPDNEASFLFDTETGVYDIIIQNDGKEKIQGLLSIKTASQEIKK